VVDAGMAHDKPLIIIADEYAHQALEKLFALPFSPPRFVPSCLCCVSLSFPRFMPETCTHYCGLASGCLQRRDGSFAFPKKNLQQL
jgi:hypothetical protein